MGITADGWLDWAIRLQPSPPTKNTNAGTNPVKGVFMHSAEGWAGTLLDPQSIYGYNGQHSWHLSNFMDGRVFQHYPLTARCHHATAANNDYVGVENEGLEAPLNEAQIANAVRFLREIGEWRGWKPSRPRSATDISHTLWEHREVVRLGGSGSQCPSGRIPWGEILRRLEEPGKEDELSQQEKEKMADYIAKTLIMRELDWEKGGLYRPVAVVEDGDMLLIQLWNPDRTQPATPPSFWVHKP